MNIFRKTVGTILLIGSLLYAGEMANDTLRLSLDEALQSALENNEQLLSSKAQIRKSVFTLEEAKSLTLPRVDAIFSYNYLDIVPGFRAQILGNIEHDLFPRLNVEQVIYDGKKTKNDILLKEEIIRSKTYSYEELEQQTKYLLTAYYYQLNSVRNQIEILKNNQAQLRMQKQMARLLVDAGKLSELEIGRIDVELDGFDTKILQLRNDYQSLSHKILWLMGKNTFAVVLPTDSLQVRNEINSTEELVQMAMRRHPTLKNFDSQIAQQEINIAIQKSARLPQVSASAYFGYEFGLEQFAFDKNDRYFLALNAKLPLFDGGNVKTRVQQAEIEISSIKNRRNYFVQQLTIQIDQTKRKIEEILEQIEIQKKILKQNKDTYRFALLEYQAGRRSNTDLLDIQKSCLNAEVTLNEMLINCILKQLELKYYTGTL